MWAEGYILFGVPRSSLTSHKTAGAFGSCKEPREGGTSGMVGQVSMNVSKELGLSSLGSLVLLWPLVKLLGLWILM